MFLIIQMSFGQLSAIVFALQFAGQAKWQISYLLGRSNYGPRIINEFIRIAKNIYLCTEASKLAPELISIKISAVVACKSKLWIIKTSSNWAGLVEL